MPRTGTVGEYGAKTLAVRAGARNAVQAGRFRESRRAPGRRLHSGAPQGLQRGCLPRTVPAVSEHAANLGKSDALGGDRHHDACEARLRLAQLERVNPVALIAVFLGELLETVRLADLDRIAAELRAERSVDDEPLDQLCELFGLLLSG
jgi:hypothetical protein